MLHACLFVVGIMGKIPFLCISIQVSNNLNIADLDCGSSKLHIAIYRKLSLTVTV